MDPDAGCMSPGRLSFSRDFVQSNVFNPSTARKDPVSSLDFDFGMLALLRTDETDSISTADELIQNGRLITGIPTKSPLKKPRESHSIPVYQSFSPLVSSIPPSTPKRWKKSSESEPLNPYASSSSSSKLKLLFRSSSAGSVRQLRHEPSLGRSASDSRASCSGSSLCCNVLPIENNKESTPNHTQRRVSKSGTTRKALTEMKVGSRTDGFPGHYQKVPSKNTKNDAWRVYSERSSNASTTTTNGTTKVAQVLHMEVCMGQSMVVSKVAKAFMKKENHSYNNNNKIAVKGA